MKQRNDELAYEMYMTPNEDGGHKYSIADIAKETKLSRQKIYRMEDSGQWVEEYREKIADRFRTKEGRDEQIDQTFNQILNVDLRKATAEECSKALKVSGQMLDFKLAALDKRAYGKFTKKQTQTMQPSDYSILRIVTMMVEMEKDYQDKAGQNNDSMINVTPEELFKQFELIEQIRKNYPENTGLDN